MRITYLAPCAPHDKHPTAGGYFFHQYLRAVSERHEVQLIVPATEENLEAASWCTPRVDVYHFSLGDRPPSAIGRAIKSFPRLPGGLTPGAHVLKGFATDPEVGKRLARSQLVEVHWGHYLPFVPMIKAGVRPRIPVTALSYDVVTQSVQRRRSEARSYTERIRCAIDLPRIKRQEVRLLNYCDVVFVFSGKDRALMGDLGVQTAVEILDPYIQLPQGPPSPVPGRILFVGSLLRPENWEGALWFLEKVWPLVAHRNSQAEVVIAGADPPDRLLAHQSSRVMITGWVDDLDPVFRCASIFVAPLFSGAGLKFKVPQAMLYSLPVVATPVAVEGVVEMAGSDVFAGVTADPREMAERILALLNDSETGGQYGSRGRTWAERQYSFGRTVETVLDVYDRLLSR